MNNVKIKKISTMTYSITLNDVVVGTGVFSRSHGKFGVETNAFLTLNDQPEITLGSSYFADFKKHVAEIVMK